MHRQYAIEEDLLSGSAASPILVGSQLAIAWGATGALFVLQFVLFVVGIVAYHAQLTAPPEAMRAALDRIGLSTGIYAAYLTAIIAVFSLGCFAVAGLIAWRQRHDAMALVASFLLVLMGSVNAPAAWSLEGRYPSLVPLVSLSVFLLTGSLILFLFLFPSGRFVPYRLAVPVIVTIAAMLLLSLGVGINRAEPPEWLFLLFVGGFAAGVVAQMYRYVRVSDRTQRQQTKWVVLGAAAALVGQVAFWLLEPLFPSALTPSDLRNTPYDLVGVTSVTFAYFLIPLSIGTAVLRYRLFEIDVIINRTLVYGTLTVGVAGTYVLIVGAFGVLLQTQDNLLVSLLGVGLVAAFFAPLRDRLQGGVNRLMYGERDDPYAVLSQLGQRLEAAFAPDAVLPAIVETVAHTLTLPYAAIALRQGDEFVVAAEHGSPQGRSLCVPLAHRGETLGQLILAPRNGQDSFTPGDRRLLRDLARQAGIAVHSVRLTADLQHANDGLREARERLVTSREEERRRLRRDLHDGLGPQLAGFTLRLDAARNLLRRDPSAADALLEDLTERSQSAVADIRRLVYALRPPALDELGLVAALRQQAESYSAVGLSVTVEAPDSLPSLPAALDVAAYRIAQEALANVARHADARACTLRLSLENGSLCLGVADDGIGIPAHHPMGVGLQSMRERAAELEGTFEVEARPEGGTRVRVRLPFRTLDKGAAGSGPISSAERAR